MRRYRKLWEEIKKHKIIVIECNAIKARTIIQAVKKEKSAEIAPRRTLELPVLGILNTKRQKIEGGKMRITFSLGPSYNAEDL